MREIVIADLDKRRPAVVLTRERVRGVMRRVTVAPITTTVKGLSTEVALGPENGLDHACVASMDNIATVSVASIGPVVGYVLPHQELALTAAVIAAFDLR